MYVSYRTYIFETKTSQTVYKVITIRRVTANHKFFQKQILTIWRGAAKLNLVETVRVCKVITIWRVAAGQKQRREIVLCVVQLDE